jgi:hypothetical protein
LTFHCSIRERRFNPENDTVVKPYSLLGAGFKHKEFNGINLL